jgi:hypothetical protein
VNEVFQTALGLIGDAGKDIAFGCVRSWLATHSATERVMRAYEKERTQWLIERAVALTEQLKTMSQDVATERHLSDLIEGPEFTRLQALYDFSAMTEALDERRSMLACAAAGSFNVKLSLGQMARVQRTLAAFDPSDVLLFAQIVDGAADGCDWDYTEDLRIARILSAGLFRDTVGWGCLRTQTAQITGDGVSFYAVMRGYVNARSEPPTRTG